MAQMSLSIKEIWELGKPAVSVSDGRPQRRAREARQEHTVPLHLNSCSAIEDEGSHNGKMQLQSMEWHESRPQQLCVTVTEVPERAPVLPGNLWRCPLRDEVVSHLL